MSTQLFLTATKVDVITALAIGILLVSIVWDLFFKPLPVFHIEDK